MTRQMKRTKVIDLLASAEYDTEVFVKGWIRTRRGNKQVCFIALNDGSTINNIQIVADVTNFDEENLKNLNTGACMAVKGKLVKSLGKGQTVEIQAQNIELLGEADADSYPLQKKGHSMEFLREMAHLRPRTNTFGAVFRIRHALAFAIHNYFNDHGFYYIHTPIITGSDAEGAGEMFQVTTLDFNKVPRTETGDVDFTKDFFGTRANLTVSGQLEGEVAAMALGQVYTFGPTFRAENSNTTRHLAEFWMIEPEVAFNKLEENIDLAEDFLNYLITYVLQNCKDDLSFLNKMYDQGLLERLEAITQTPFERIDYTTAVDIIKQAKEKFEYDLSWGKDLQSEHERYLVEKHFKKPVVVTNYPKDIKAFYMKMNEDGKTVAAMDILFPGIGEIVGGSEREANYEKLLERVKAMGLHEKELWWYLDLRKFGTAPHAGFGLGFERLMLFITGMSNIRDVIPFPRFPGNAEF